MNCPHYQVKVSAHSQVKVFVHFLAMVSAWGFAKVSAIPKTHVRNRNSNSQNN
jgi:hypothetical protein